MNFHQPKRTVLVVSVDAARARLFWLEPRDEKVELREDSKEALVHPASRLRPSDLYTDSFTGGVFGPGGRHQGFDDHQNLRTLEERRRFAKEIIDQLAKIVRARKVDELILIASHAEYSALREERERQPLGCNVRSTIGEATRASPRKLHEMLRSRELLR